MTTETETPPSPEALRFQRAMEAVTKGVLAALQAEKQVNIVEFAVELNASKLRHEALIDILADAGLITRDAVFERAAVRAEEFAAFLNRPHIAIAAPRRSQ